MSKRDLLGPWGRLVSPAEKGLLRTTTKFDTPRTSWLRVFWPICVCHPLLGSHDRESTLWPAWNLGLCVVADCVFGNARVDMGPSRLSSRWALIVSLLPGFVTLHDSSQTMAGPSASSSLDLAVIRAGYLACVCCTKITVQGVPPNSSTQGCLLFYLGCPNLDSLRGAMPLFQRRTLRMYGCELNLACSTRALVIALHWYRLVD